MTPASPKKAGFTLLEVLVAVAILAVITAVVYASLSSVVTATEIARTSADEMRMRQFLNRSFQTNFATIVADPVYENERYVLIGMSERGPRGAMDSIEFASSAPLIGGTSPPGSVKRVYYGAVPNSSSSTAFFSSDDPGAIGSIMLESSEQCLLDPQMASEYGTDIFGGAQGSDNFQAKGLAQRLQTSNRSTGTSQRTPSLLSEEGQGPGWNVYLDQFDVSYFDGYEWVDDWDSIEFGRMPWAVRIRLNYARTEDEYEADRAAGMDNENDFDYQIVIPIPLGIGLIPEEERMNNIPSRPGGGGNLFGSTAREQQRNGATNRANQNTRGGRMFGN